MHGKVSPAKMSNFTDSSHCASNHCASSHCASMSLLFVMHCAFGLAACAWADSGFEVSAKFVQCVRF